jgi:DNA-binding transcriptional MerR regulator
MTINDDPWGRLGSPVDISALAKAAGVTTRTLRHYDAIGLLRPATTADDGRRSYGEREVLRLQRILMLRALGLPLEQIAAVCNDHSDPVEALRQHRAEVSERRAELTALLATIDRTIDHLEEGTDMTTADAFEGLPGYDAELQREYQKEASQRWGSEVVDDSVRRAAGLTPEQAGDVMAEHDAIAREAADLLRAGVAPDDVAAQALVARHHTWVSTFWAPNAEAYRGLAQMYVEDERFRRQYDVHGDGTAAYLRDAIDVFAEGLPA